MDKQIFKTVMLDNQNAVQRYEVFKRNFHFEDFGNYVLVGIRRAGKSFLIYQRIQQLLAEGTEWDNMTVFKICLSILFHLLDRNDGVLSNLLDETSVFLSKRLDKGTQKLLRS